MHLINPFWGISAGGGGGAVTWAPASSDAALSNGDLTAASPSGAGKSIIATVGHASGKYYFEVHIDNWLGGTEPEAGVATATWGAGFTSMSSAGAWGVATAGTNSFGNGSAKSAGTTWAANDTICVAIDIDAGKVWFGKNGTWILSGDPAAGTNETWSGLTGTIYPACYVTTAPCTARFAAADFVYTAPSGFSPW